MKALFWILAGTAAFLALFIPTFSEWCYHFIFSRGKQTSLDEIDLSRTYYAPYTKILLPAMKQMKELPYERLEMKSRDGLSLKALYYGQGSGHCAVFVHGYRATPFNNFAAVSRDVMEMGYDLFFPIQRAHGESEGNRITLGQLEQQDLLDWLNVLNETYAPESIVLYGLSMGSTTVALASDRLPENVRCMVLDCGFSNLYDRVKGRFRSTHVPGPEFFTRIINRMCRRRMGFDMHETDTAHALQHTDVPALFIHGTADRSVTLEEGRRNIEACASEKEVFLVKDAPHAIGYMAGGEETKTLLRQFLKRNDPRETRDDDTNNVKGDTDLK